VTLTKTHAKNSTIAKWQLIQDEGAAVVLQPSYRDAETVYVTSATVPYPPDAPFEKRAPAWDLRVVVRGTLSVSEGHSIAHKVESAILDEPEEELSRKKATSS